MNWRRRLFENLYSLIQRASIPKNGHQTPQLAIAGALEPASLGGVHGWQVPSSLQELGDLLGENLWLAVPKSKVSPSRKRMKWKQHIPKPVGWSRCDRCGEAKRPHRICTKHADICAMRDEEYIEHLRKKSANAD